MVDSLEIKILEFSNPDLWRAWLDTNHLTLTQGIWLKIYKKGSKIQSITYAEALDEALCFGWIDGQKKTFDNDAWLQKFTPRRKRSMWSKVNVGHIDRLEKLKKMTPNGQLEVEKAKKDGRWDAAYQSSSTAEIPPDFIARLEQHPLAKAAFGRLNKSERYSIFFRLNAAKKPETRERNIQKLIETLSTH